MKIEVRVKDQSQRTVGFEQAPILVSVTDRSLFSNVKQNPKQIITIRVESSPVLVEVVAPEGT